VAPAESGGALNHEDVRSGSTPRVSDCRFIPMVGLKQRRPDRRRGGRGSSEFGGERSRFPVGTGLEGRFYRTTFRAPAVATFEGEPWDERRAQMPFK